MTSPVSPSRRTKLAALSKRLGRSAVPLLLIVASLTMSWVVTSNHSAAFSPRDEWVYLDYLQKLPAQGVVRQGETIGEDPRERMACIGVRDYGVMGPACDGDLSDLGQFPQQAVNTADVYTPLYFAASYPIAKAVQAVTGADMLTAGRLVGGVWLAATVLTLYAFMRSLRVGRVVGLGLGLALIASPLAWWTYTYISTDAPTLLLATLVLWAGVSYAQGRAKAWPVVAMSALAVAFKSTNLLAVGLVALLLLVHAYFRARDGRSGSSTHRTEVTARSLILTAGAAAVAGVAAQVLWLGIRAALAVGPSPDQGNLAGLGISELGRLATMVIPDTIVSNSVIYGSGTNQYQIPEFVVEPLSWITVAAVVGSFFALNREGIRRSLVVATTIGAVLLVPALAISLAVVQGSYFPLPARYGAPLIPAILVLASLLITNRVAGWVLLGYTSLLLAYVLYAAPHLS